MTWNWQQPDWPEFSWRADRLREAEARFLTGGGVIVGAVSHLDEDERERLTIDLMCDEAVTTSEIEGELLDRDSVQSSIRRALGLEGDGRRARPAEQGIAEMMVHLYRTSAVALDGDMLGTWHEMLMRGRRDLREIGRYRTHEEPMQIVSGRMYEPRVHFEAPPSSRVPAEMAAFLEWFDESAPGASGPLPALTRAGIAHIYFESIHPFEDGNGRIGRAILEKALAQGLARMLHDANRPAGDPIACSPVRGSTYQPDMPSPRPSEHATGLPRRCASFDHGGIDVGCNPGSSMNFERVIGPPHATSGPGGPTLTALAATILLRRRRYYEMLEASNKRNDIDDWLAWFAGIALEAQARTTAQVEFLIDKSKLLDRLRDALNERQRKVLLRVLAEGPEGFTGGLSAGNYQAIAKTSPATARRDLADLVEKKALTRTGERRHARYHLTIPLRPVAPVVIDESGRVNLQATMHEESELD